jgi:beta-N-acetylhexosaminidase
VQAAILTCGLVITSCSNDDDSAQPSTDEVEEQLQKMSLREKVGQLFYVRLSARSASIRAFAAY